MREVRLSWLSCVRALCLAVLLALPSCGGCSDDSPDDRSDPCKPPAVDATGPVRFGEAVRFIYANSACPRQIGLDESKLDPLRVAVVRGFVRGSDGKPLAGASITFPGHPQFGASRTLEDGSFDFVTNGGGDVVVRFAADGKLSAQRGLSLPRNQFAVLEDVVLIAESGVATGVQFGSQWQVATGETSAKDESAPRTVHVLFPPNTRATVTKADGSTAPFAGGTFRVTEFTRGPLGDKAMPGTLPPSSAYTYASNFGFDEAKDAKGIAFEAPVFAYLDNFLRMKVGARVPSGAFSPDANTWEGDESGRVVAIVAGTGGVPAIDADGDGRPDSDADLHALGVVPGELDAAKSVLRIGSSYFRVPLRHFSAWDFNWGFAPPGNSGFPPNPPDQKNDNDPCLTQGGSYFACESQVLFESIPLIGTRFSLSYASDRVPGRRDNSTLTIPITAGTIPGPVKRAELEIFVLGKKITKTFAAPLAPNLTEVFTWDGTDGYGRPWPGQALATVRIGFVYDGVYVDTNEFAQWGASNPNAGPISGDQTRRELTLWRTSVARVGAWNALGQGFGGWSFSGNHAYDAATETLFYGDGRRRTPDGTGAAMDLVAGDGSIEHGGTGGPAKDAKLLSPDSLAVASDGTLYIGETQARRIRKVDTAGIITNFAGTGNPGFSGDNGPAVQADINGPKALAIRSDGAVCFTADDTVRCVTRDGIVRAVVGPGDKLPTPEGVPAREVQLSNLWGLVFAPDGAMYFSDGAQVHKLDPNGQTVRTVAGVAGNGGDPGDNIPALNAALFGPAGLAVDKEGALYVAGDLGYRVRRIDPSGRVSTVAGNGEEGNADGDGGDALAAKLGQPLALTIDEDGSMYIGTRGTLRIRRVYKGRISTFAGGGDELFFSQGMLAKRVTQIASRGMAIGPDGDLYVVDEVSSRALRLRKPMPKAARGETVIAEQDGSELYVFDERGRHLRTLDPLTLATRLTFAYDQAGRLAHVDDPYGNMTTIKREANGRATAIVAPFGQTTSLEYSGSQGDALAAITDPLGRGDQFSYEPGLLLSKRVDRGGGVHTMQYDPRGLLIKDTNAENASWNLSRENESPRRVRVTTGMNRSRLHEQASYADLDEQRALTSEDGTKTAWTQGQNGLEHVTLPDGTQTDTLFGADPRFGMQAPYVSRSVVTLPSGLARTVDTKWSARFAADGTLQGLDAKRTTVSGEASTSFDAASRTWSYVTVAGRRARTTLDAQGRVVRDENPGLQPLDVRYDDRGRIAQVTEGDRRIVYDYASNGALQGIQDALGPVLALDRDVALRATASTVAGGARTTFGYDALDSVLALTPPGKPLHAMTYAKDGLETSYAAPGAGLLSRAYDADRALSSVTHEDGAQTTVERDSASRPVTLRFPGGTIVTAYDAATGNVSSLTGPNNAALRFGYDGVLRTSVTAAGAAPGTVTWSYDSLFRPKEESIPGGGSEVGYDYDADGLLTAAGPITLTRDPASGFLSSMSAGSTRSMWTYTPHGEVATSQTSSGAGALLDLAYRYDARGRLVEKHENGIVWGYEYDLRNRLTRVTKGGAEQARYTFDANGNRTDGGAQVDGQDRLTRRGDVTYTYTPRGQRATKQSAAGTTTYSYDGRGNLASVQLPSGVRIAYEVDALGRRIAKSRGDTVTHRWLYRSGLQPAAEVDASGNVLTQFVYARGRNVPDAMMRGGRLYTLVTDHLGSVRYVVDSSSNAAQTLDYDAWGRVTTDSSAGFQPFGFAGGIYDPDTGLVHFGARDYDPETGTWIQKDPIRFGGGFNLYEYASSNPVDLVDPTGLEPCDTGRGGTGYGGGGGETGGGGSSDTYGDPPPEPKPSDPPRPPSLPVPTRPGRGGPFPTPGPTPIPTGPTEIPGNPSPGGPAAPSPSIPPGGGTGGGGVIVPTEMCGNSGSGFCRKNKTQRCSYTCTDGHGFDLEVDCPVPGSQVQCPREAWRR